MRVEARVRVSIATVRPLLSASSVAAGLRAKPPEFSQPSSPPTSGRRHRRLTTCLPLSCSRMTRFGFLGSGLCVWGTKKIEQRTKKGDEESGFVFGFSTENEPLAPLGFILFYVLLYFGTISMILTQNKLQLLSK